MKRRLGLRNKVLLASTGVIAVLVLSMILLLAQERHSRREVLRISAESQGQLVAEVARARALAVATQLADTVTNDLYYFDLQSIGEQLGFTLRQAPITRALVFDLRGQVVHDGSREISTYGSTLDQPLVREALATEGALIDQGPEAVIAVQRIRIGDEVLGGVLVRFDLAELNRTVAIGNRQLAARLESSTQWRLGSVAVLLGLVALLGLLSALVIQRVIVRPILRLANAARQMEAGDYRDYRLASGRGDEIGELERVFERMSERVAEAHRTVERKAYMDKLTGLPNRHAFDEALAARTATDLLAGNPFALLFIDIDNLKQINDRFGHAAGDTALVRFARQAADRLEQLAPGAAWLARIGGDEFAVLCDGGGVAPTGRELAEAIVALFRPPDASLLTPMSVSVSIGVALYPDHARAPSDLLRCADSAMYGAKHLGKNRVQVFADDPA